MEIHVLRKQGYSLRRIAEEVGCAVNTVRSHLAAQRERKYERKQKRRAKLAPYQCYLLARQTAAHPHWIPATVLYSEIVAQGYDGGISQLRAFLHKNKPTLPKEPVIRFETKPGEQMQVDWVEFRKGKNPLYAFCATLGYSRASYVEFVTNMKVETLIMCHQQAFIALGGIPRRILYDNMKTIVLERDVDGPGVHRYHAGFLDYAKHNGFVIKLCRPYRAKTKGKVERFNSYLRYSFYVPLAVELKQLGLELDVVTANARIREWLKTTANNRIHGTTGVRPNDRLREEQHSLQTIPADWRGNIEAARPQCVSPLVPNFIVRQQVSPVAIESIHRAMSTVIPSQHPLTVYQQLLSPMKGESK